MVINFEQKWRLSICQWYKLCITMNNIDVFRKRIFQFGAQYYYRYSTKMNWITCLEGGPRRVNHAAAAVGKHAYSFGGYCTGEDSREIRPIDVHVLNTETLRWTRLPIEYDNPEIPFQRYGHTAVAYESKIYIWGGRNDEYACNNLYCFDTTTNRWHSPEVKGSIPGARDGHSACIYGHCMYIFGGYEEEEESFSQEVFVLDLKEMTWSYIATLGTPPSFRDFHSAVVLKDRMYIFGGRGDPTYPNPSNEDMYSSHIIYLDFETFRWHRPIISGDEPTGRRSHSAFVHSNYMYIFGGYNGAEEKHYNEMYQYNPDTSEWKYIQPLGTPPCERRRQSCIVIEDRMYLFGGTSPREKHRNDSISSEDLDYDEADHLMDHSDLHVLDFNPSLLTLSILAVIKHNIDITCLPASLQFQIRMMTLPNTITMPLAKNMEEHLRI